MLDEREIAEAWTSASRSNAGLDPQRANSQRQGISLPCPCFRRFAQPVLLLVCTFPVTRPSALRDWIPSSGENRMGVTVSDLAGCLLLQVVQMLLGLVAHLPVGKGFPGSHETTGR